MNQQTSELFTPLYLACQRGSIDTVKILSSYGANHRLKDENGLNCLHTGEKRCLSLFFMQKFFSILILACQNSHFHIVRWLVRTNMNLHNENSFKSRNKHKNSTKYFSMYFEKAENSLEKLTILHHFLKIRFIKASFRRKSYFQVNPIFYSIGRNTKC